MDDKSKKEAKLERKKAYQKLYYEKNKEKLNLRTKKYYKLYYEQNKKIINAKHRKKYIENKDEIRSRKRKNEQKNKEKRAKAKKIYREKNDKIIKEKAKLQRQKPENKEKINLYARNWRKNNKEKHRAKMSKYQNKKYKTDSLYRLRKAISGAVRYAIKNNKSVKNNKSILTYLSYTMEELKQHLEKQFEPWMNWQNWGVYKLNTWDDNDSSTWTWQIDHIIHHHIFCYTNMEDQAFKDCWALSNLRPLSAKINTLENNAKRRLGKK